MRGWKHHQGGHSYIIITKRHKECAVVKVCDLGKSNCILAYTGYIKHNPEIDLENRKREMRDVHRECIMYQKRWQK